ncbi:MAG: UDP-3-O-(3-hydroxymyristoyl)glucosamine N-acyltransferase [Gammaproteobacteria bacterium]|nr:UDP-3-O-(3-hydroxymyristoyl)glucosamine N-acyltransferase [Gammaproteobacteria bacterium]
MEYTLEQIAKELDVEIIGDTNFIIDSVASLESATSSSVVFISNKKFLDALGLTKSKVVVTTKDYSKFCNDNVILVDDPYLIFAKISSLFQDESVITKYVHNSAIVKSKIDTDVLISENVVIEENVNIGNNSYIGAGSYIGKNVTIGINSYIYPNVSIYDDTIIGSNTKIHSGVVIGSDGFGYALNGKSWFKIPQIGKVIIGENVEIGSNTTIDRGTLDNTEIGNGVKLDNQIQVAHNVIIGENTLIAACVGIAGSAKIGKNCVIGGMAGIQGHIEICDNTHVTGMTKISCSIKKPGIYASGTPTMPYKDWLKSAALFKKLNKLFEKK